MKKFRRVVNGEVRFNFSPDALCPCGSELISNVCCLTNKGFRKEPNSTIPPGPQTGNSIASCYANSLSNCGTKISREHYVSKNLLEYMNNTENLKVEGLSWAKDKSTTISPNALASKVLCDRHNSALTNLDSISLRIFQSLDEDNVTGSGHTLLYLFNGYDIERWLLKILCGVVKAESTRLQEEIDISIQDYWLKILFAGERFPDNQGLYICKSIGHKFEGQRGLGMRLIVGSGKLAGIGLYVCGYELILSMTEFPNRKFDDREFIYRPMEIYSSARDFEKSVLFTWDGNADLGTISVQIVEY